MGDCGGSQQCDIHSFSAGFLEGRDVLAIPVIYPIIGIAENRDDLKTCMTLNKVSWGVSNCFI